MRVVTLTAFLALASVGAYLTAGAYEYRGPVGPFPTGNPAAPLDTGPIGQLKDGFLGFTNTVTGNVLKFERGHTIAADGNPIFTPLLSNNQTIITPGEAGLYLTTSTVGNQASVIVSKLCFLTTDPANCVESWGEVVGSGGGFWKLVGDGIEYASATNPRVSIGLGGALSPVSITGSLNVSDGPTQRQTGFYYDLTTSRSSIPRTAYTLTNPSFSWWQTEFPSEFQGVTGFAQVQITSVRTAGQCHDTNVSELNCTNQTYDAAGATLEQDRFVYDFWMQQGIPPSTGYSVGYTKFEKKIAGRAGGHGSFAGDLTVGGKFKSGPMTVFSTTTASRQLHVGVAGDRGYAYLSGYDTAANKILPLVIQGVSTTEAMVVIGTTTIAGSSVSPGTRLNVWGAVNATKYLINGQPISSEDPRWAVVPGGIAYNGGSVGIGTGTSTAPIGKLQVLGDVRLSNANGIPSKLTFGDGNTDSRVPSGIRAGQPNDPSILAFMQSEFGSIRPDTCPGNIVGTAFTGTIDGNTPPSGVYSCNAGYTGRCRDVYWGPFNDGGVWGGAWSAALVTCYANTDPVVKVSGAGGSFVVMNKDDQPRLTVSQQGYVTVAGSSSTIAGLFSNGGFGGITGGNYGDAAHGYVRGWIGHGVDIIPATDVASPGYRVVSGPGPNSYNASLIYFGNVDWVGIASIAGPGGTLLPKGTTFTHQQLENSFTTLKVYSTSTGIRVTGNAAISGGLTVGTTTVTGSLRLPVGAAAGRVLTSDASGNATWGDPPEAPRMTGFINRIRTGIISKSTCGSWTDVIDVGFPVLGGFVSPNSDRWTTGWHGAYVSPLSWSGTRITVRTSIIGDICDGHDFSWIAFGSSEGLGGLGGGSHTAQECTAQGGVVVTSDGATVCKFTGTNISCPSGWGQAENWSATVPRTCSGSCSTCTTGSHIFRNIPVESCMARDENVHGACSVSRICLATMSEIGCI
jgi:hypothetical protein